MANLVYITVPYSDDDFDRIVSFVAGLHRAYPEKTFLCPMIQIHGVRKQRPVADEPWTDSEYFRMSEFIHSCQELWVPKFNGWMESEIVQYDIALAEKFRVPIYYMILKDKT